MKPCGGGGSGIRTRILSSPLPWHDLRIRYTSLYSTLPTIHRQLLHVQSLKIRLQVTVREKTMAIMMLLIVYEL
jgi:hypothetical protein